MVSFKVKNTKIAKIYLYITHDNCTNCQSILNYVLHIDASVLSMMSEKDLSMYIPQYGDRLAAVAFCCNTHHSLNHSDTGTSRRNHLLERIWTKVVIPKSKAVKREEKSGKRKATRIEIDLMNFSEKEIDFIQVQTVKVGGTRHLNVDRYTTIEIQT